MVPTLCCAYLRVYQPLDAFDQQELERIRRSTSHPAAQGARAPVRHALGLISPAERHEVFVRESEGLGYLCPAQNRLRALLGIVEFNRGLSPEIADAFFSADEVEDARRELESIQARVPPPKAYLIQSPWHVPLRWFIAFDPADRRIEHDADHLRIRYVARVADAHQRVTRALTVLKHAVLPPGVAGMIFELGEWLATFDGRGFVELDYASVSQLFTDDELADDHTAADLAEAVQALSHGDTVAATEHYTRAGLRWVAARERGSQN